MQRRIGCDARIPSSIDEPFRFMIKIVPEHVSRVGVEREESKPYVFLLEEHDGY